MQETATSVPKRGRLSQKKGGVVILRLSCWDMDVIDDVLDECVFQSAALALKGRVPAFEIAY